LKRFFFNWWVLTAAVAVLVALILAWPLPMLLHFLRPWWARLLLVLLVALVWGTFAGLRLWKARKASEAMAEALAKSDPGDAEARTVAGRLAEALAALKAASGRKADYLYSRPWYLIIGPPGAGKTTALLNSGLHFPVANTALKGVGGTRNLDFWFTDEAVLVDTAGRYTTQDSDSATDAKGWEGFLGMLRKHRPLRPINGVLVAIGLDQILKGDRAAIDAAASAVRRRLAEIDRTLELDAPVYVIFTKADLMAGFGEFWEDLDAEGRRAVLGATLPVDVRADAANLAAAYDGVAQSVADRMSRRLQDEPDVRRRGLILGFPAQIDALRDRALRFLEGAFPAGAAGANLRGFYLTSGVQEGAPLDRLLGGIAQVYDTPQRPAAGQGRAYFLNRLLTEVIFPEAGLAKADPKADARRRLQLIGGLAGVAAISVLMIVLWTVSFFANRTYQDQLRAGADNAREQARATGIDLQEVRETDPDLEQAIPYLNALRQLPGGFGDRLAHGTPFFQGFGLYQGGHARTAQQTYLQALQRVLLPRLLLRLEKTLQLKAADPLATYDALKVYLMLGGYGPLDAKAVRAWIVNDWETQVLPGADRETERKQLAQHLDALLGDEEMQGVWPDRRAPLDAALIASSRATAQRLSLADRAYAILRQKASGEGQPWSAGTVLGSGDAPAFADGDAVRQLSVPYFFTRDGYEKAYLLGLPLVQQDLERDLWVLGDDAKTASVRDQMGGVRDGVAADYAREYIAAWDGAVARLQPADLFHNAGALAAFTKSPSPLKVFLLALKDNTTFTGGAAGAADKLLAAKLKAVPGAAAALTGSGGVDAGKLISDHFKPLQDYVGDGKAPAPIDEFVTAIKTAGTATVAAGFAGGAADQGQLAAAQGGVAVAAGAAPPTLKPFIDKVAKGGAAASAAVVQGGLSDAYKPLAQSCSGATVDRYPFFAQAQYEATVGDMGRVFGASGELDTFTRTRLDALLDKTGPKWRWRPDAPLAAGFNPLSAERLQKAQELRDLVSSGVSFTLEYAGFGGGVTAADFSSGGTTYRFETSSVGAKPVQWSLTNGSPEAHVVLYAGSKEVKRFEGQGPWALFKLMDQSTKENAGPTALKATFGEGPASATFKINLPSPRNPFSRGGAWSFRCPDAM
jgi:type VI secretion system protein ImpL